jgi:hypothetical protein
MKENTRMRDKDASKSAIALVFDRDPIARWPSKMARAA